MTAWVHKECDIIEEEALTKLQEAWDSSEQKDECTVCLEYLERAYWMGTEVGLLGGYGFQGVTLGVDGSCKDGKMGSGCCKFKEEGAGKCARVGREEEGTSSNRPELGGIVLALQSAALSEDALLLCDNERVRAGRATFLIKVKSHRGEPINEQADTLPEKGREISDDNKRWDDRTDLMTFEVRKGDTTVRSVWTNSVRNAFQKQVGRAKLQEARAAAARHRRHTKSFSPTSTTVTPSRSTRCNTKSSGSLVLTPHVHSRSPTPTTLLFATTAALAVVTHVARHLGLRARVRPPARTPLAAPAALVALPLPRLLLSTTTGATKASTSNTTLSQSSFRATT
jgi:ribonuclease HI